MFEFLIDCGFYIIYNLIYYCTYIYNIVVQLFESNNYELCYTHLHTKYNQYLPYDKNNIYNDYKFIKIKYIYKNNIYYIVINDYVPNISKYYPPYEPYLLEDQDLNIKKILTATIRYNDDTEKDISDIINKYAGPCNNFYKDLENYKYPSIQDIWGEDVKELNLLTNDVKQIKITNKLTF